MLAALSPAGRAVVARHAPIVAMLLLATVAMPMGLDVLLAIAACTVSARGGYQLAKAG